MHETPSSAHGRAVLHLCEALTAAGHTVISANTDERADPQVFAQSDAGELAFYFVRANAAEPDDAALSRFRALAAKHQVSAYYAPVTLEPEPRCLGLRPL